MTTGKTMVLRTVSLFLGVLMTGGAQASSFVVVESVKDRLSPSMIELPAFTPSLVLLPDSFATTAVAAAPPPATRTAEAAQPERFIVPLAFPLPGEAVPETTVAEIKVPLAFPLPGEEILADVADVAGFTVPLAFPLPGEAAAPAVAAADFEVPLAFPLPGEAVPAKTTAVYQVPLPFEISPSIMAFGTPIPAVSYEILAAIQPEKAKPRRPAPQPTVMRAGVLGGPALASAPVAPASPARETRPDADRPKPSQTASRTPDRKEDAPKRDEPAPAPVAPPPTRLPE